MLTPNYAAIKQGPDNRVTARYKCSSGNNNQRSIEPVQQTGAVSGSLRISHCTLQLDYGN